MKKNIFKKSVAMLMAVISAVLPCSGTSTDITAYAATTSTISSSSSQSSQDWPVAPELVSGSAILIDADTGAILYEKNAHEISYPASTTKILTGLLTIENDSLNETLTFSREAANSVTWEDAQLGAKAEEQMTIEQVLYGMLLHSANEFAYALGEYVAGSLPAFADMMNERAKELGALNTHFTNASGLHDINHYTTAYDMAMIARGCYNNTAFINIDSSSETYVIPPTNKTSTTRYVKHRHQMIKGRTYEYEYCKGGKTGFTDEAGCTLVTFAEKDDMRLICVCFKSDTNLRYVDTKSLFDWGFANFKKITASGSSVSSLFTSDSFYDSKVFNQYNLDLNLNASTLTLPNNLSIGDVVIDIDKNNAPSSNNGVYTATLDFKAKNNIVGSAVLTISTPDDLAASSNAPLLMKDSGASVTPKKCFVIRLSTLLIIIGAVFFIYACIDAAKTARRKRRRRGRRRKLRM